MELRLRRHLTFSQLASSGHRHLSAASGLVVVGSKFYIIGDDEVCLAVFPESGLPGEMVRLLPRQLPREPTERKAAKPDFETLLRLPTLESNGNPTLLALGSGSTDRRCSGVMISLDAEGDVGGVRRLDMKPLFQAIAKEVEEVNIEGAVVQGSRMLLFNRGNTSHPENAVLTVGLAPVLNGGTVEVLTSTRLRLPRVAGVPLSITDACSLDDNSVIVSAVAEDTADAYADGKLVGAAIGVLDQELTLIRVDALPDPIKIEGIHAWRSAHAISFLAVSDPDDPSKPGCLFEGSISV